MGPFDNLFSRESAGRPLDRAEAYMAVILCAAACDGHISDSESRNVATGLMRMRLFEDWTQQKLKTVYDECERIIKRDGVEALLKKASDMMPEELRVTAFANACDLILADGMVEETEKKYLELLAETLQVDPDTAVNVAEVMILKNRG